MGNNLSLLVALGAGVLSFLSPCVLPLVPAYFGILAGPGVLETGNSRIRLPVFLHSLTFVLGFSAIFVGLGALAGWAGFSFTSQILLRRIAGSLLIALGAFMLLATRFPALNFEKRLNPGKSTTTGYLRSLLIGGIFAFAWTPCVSPILGGILALALDAATAWRGALLLAVYSLGLGIPFLVLGIGFDFVMPLIKQLNRFSLIVYIFSGLFLITSGVLTLTRG